MESCPKGYVCFNREFFVLLLIVAFGLIAYGVTRQRAHMEVVPSTTSESVNTASQIETDTLRRVVRDSIRETRREEPVFLDSTPTYSNAYVSHVSQSPPSPPMRPNPYAAINIPTRGNVPSYTQVGVLYSNKRTTAGSHKPDVLPLYGRPLHPGASKWQYYTSTDNYHSVRVPIYREGKKCQGDYGCSELYDGDLVSVEPYPGDFRVSLYELEHPRYLPHVF